MTDPLDSEELFHLALQAANEDKHEAALSYLRRALVGAPEDARLHYLMGAEHAQIGMYDRAVKDMEKALALDPKLHTAAFQLGLLHLTSGRIVAAEQTWRGLDALPADHSLRLFKDGLLHLGRDDFERCAELLQKGIDANRENAVLNADMKRILENIRAQPSTPAPGPGPVAQPSPSGGHLLLNAYRRDGDRRG